MNETDFLYTTEANDTLPHCVCSLDYGSFPIILLHCLPLKVRHLIINRLARSNLPQFVLTTYEGGQWSLVQLHSNDSIQITPSRCTVLSSGSQNCVVDIDSSGSKLSTDINSAELRVSTSTNFISSIEFNIDPYTTAYFSNSCVQFKLTAKTSNKHWYCPFCTAAYSITSGNYANILERHMRLHVELRCCVDCSTLLPNNTFSIDCQSTYSHKCNELISSQVKDDILQTSFNNNNPVYLPYKIVDLPIPGFKLSSVSNTSVSNLISIKDCTNHEADGSDEFRTLDCDNKTQLEKCETLLNPTSTNSSSTYVSTGNRQRVCTKCKVHFKTPAQYQQHLKNVHRGKKFICQDCNSLFSTKGNLTTHFNQVHNHNASLTCPICNKNLSNRFNLDRHIHSVHASNKASSCSLPSNEKNPSFFDASCLDENESSEDPCQANTILVSTPDTVVSRGYYLYLSNSKSYQSVNTTVLSENMDPSAETQSVLQSNPSTVDSKSVSLVAEINLMPCLPSNPDAQLGVGGKAWKQNINILKPSTL